jgi:hypothetical protein
MTKKVYTVLKTVKVGKVELAAGEDVSLEPGQAEKLLGTFVEEKGASATKGDASAAPAPKASKTSDGL